jgi:hypothetical protein
VNVARAELKQLLAPALIALVLALGGTALVWKAGEARAQAQRLLAAAQAERRQSVERLNRIAEEEREVSDKLNVYQRLKQLNIIGEEQRLEWAETMTRIRRERELLDLRYSVDRQRLLASLPGKPASVDFFASSMKLDLALLHEEDLLRFLTDLRNSGNAFYSVKRCALTRTGQAVGATTMSPRLRAECEIDLITVVDRAAKR